MKAAAATSSRRALKRKVSDLSSKSQGRDIVLSQQYVIKGRCLGKFMFVATKTIDSVPYAQIPSRCDWLMMMMNNVKRNFDYKEGFKLALREIKSLIPRGKSKSGGEAIGDEAKDSQPDELDLSDGFSRSDDDASDAGSNDEKQRKSHRRKSDTEVITLTIRGHELKLLNLKKVVHVKFVKDNVRALIDIIKSFQPGVPLSEASNSQRAPVSSSCPSDSSAGVRLNVLTSKFVLTYHDAETKSELRRELAIVTAVSETFQEAVRRTRSEAQRLWNELDKSTAVRY